MNFTPADCDHLRKLLEEAVKPIQETMGIKLDIGRMSYRDNITVKLTASKVGDSGRAETKEWNDYKTYAKWDEHLEVEWLGQSFVDSNGTEHTIVGYKSRARKRPVLTEASNGSTYTWEARSVERMMRWQEKKAVTK